MKILVRILILLFSISYINAEECYFFTKSDVLFIKRSLKENNLLLKEGGFFVDIKNNIVRPQKDIHNKIKKNGIAYIFPDKVSHRFFIQYLKKIEDNPCSFLDKDINYKFDGKKYIFTLLLDEKKITIRILLHGPYIEEFGFQEESAVYSFEKIDGKMVLSEINAAG